MAGVATREEVAAPAARPGHRVRWARAGGLAALLVALGLAGYLLFQYVVTGWITGRAQAELRDRLSARLEDPRPAPPQDVAPAGDAVALIRIPRIGLDMVVVEGSGQDSLRRGPGHYEGTAYPWEDSGRVAIAGHRTTYARPFWALDRLERGDRIVLVTEFGTHRYRVTRREEVLPDEVSVLRQTDGPTLVLTTCTPRFSSALRLVVYAVRLPSPA
ncbi:MAG: class E sortase [Actinobacteria bacterium]|nr:class E sortase [Actinomycetota bacterium]